MFSSPLFKRSDVPADYGKMPENYDFDTKSNLSFLFPFYLKITK